ncbi:hypothetical protein [Hymenobacter canadensis]|uniref:DUF2178 domain-containing protein n=1 Tax=Hymenobacter canadensis TaxID=2999067 RepID=A0ABY7LN15_9BACT|nr:hypothetical protein [Hymenobacter canadensis]WBA40989.1 hypothetical protein O3303_14315 [Hymenobacter canadensis]
MKKVLLPYYCKYVSMLLLLSACGFVYLQSVTGLVLALIAGILAWVFSAERIEDERTAYRRLLAFRATTFAILLFGSVSAVLVLSGRSASPTIFCVAPVALVVYLVAFYGGLLMPFQRNCAE